MAKNPEKAEQPLSIEEQRQMLEGVDLSDVPDIPQVAVVMEDQNPERFKEIMAEGDGEMGIQQMINDLPGRVLDAFREG